MATEREPHPDGASPRTVLVVDDEEAVAALLVGMLRGMGFDVLVAGDGPQAVREYEAHHDDIQLVLLDMVMPGMDGRQVLQALRSIDPGVRAIVGSAYAGDPETSFDGLRDVAFISKPYGRNELRKVIHSVLDRSAEGD